MYGCTAWPKQPTMFIKPTAIPAFRPPTSTMEAQLAACPKSNAAAATHIKTVALRAVSACRIASIAAAAMRQPVTGKTARPARLQPLRFTNASLSIPPTRHAIPPQIKGKAEDHSESSKLTCCTSFMYSGIQLTKNDQPMLPQKKYIASPHDEGDESKRSHTWASSTC